MNAFDYIVGAAGYIYAYEEEGNFAFPTTFEDLAKGFNDYFNVEISSDVSALAMRELARLGLIGITDDKYAGMIVQAQQRQFDAGYSALADKKYKRFISPSDDAGIIYKRAFSNPTFWRDLEAETNPNNGNGDAEEEAAEQIPIPASDRIVTLSHNSEEGRAIIGSVDLIIDDLEKNNRIADEAGVERERLLAEARATRELIKGDRVTLFKLKSLVWTFFQEIYAKFREKAADWGVEQVVAILAKMLDLLK